MAGFARTKRVTDPFDDRVKERIFGRGTPVYVSSGTEHSRQNDDESPCLSDLLHCFLENEEDNDEAVRDVSVQLLQDNDSDTERDSSSFLVSDSTNSISEAINSTLLSQNTDKFRNVLLTHVLRAAEVFSCVKIEKQNFRRNVMEFLRNLGYNAAICKTKWESSGGLTAGNYEFIDVIKQHSETRYFIDLNFAGEFEIARQTSQYNCLLQNLPNVFIGKSDDLKQIVKLMSDSAKRSLKSRGLLLPPWRKNRFMQNKWFGPFRSVGRVNYIPTNLAPLSVVKCRLIGFNAVNNPPLLPAATRTR